MKGIHQYLSLKIVKRIESGELGNMGQDDLGIEVKHVPLACPYCGGEDNIFGVGFAYPEENISGRIEVFQAYTHKGCKKMGPMVGWTADVTNRVIKKGQ